MPDGLDGGEAQVSEALAGREQPGGELDQRSHQSSCSRAWTRGHAGTNMSRGWSRWSECGAGKAEEIQVFSILLTSCLSDTAL